MSSNYVVWRRAILTDACSLSKMKGYPDDWKLLAGLSLAAEFPPTALMAMARENSKRKLTDCLYNANMIIVASMRLRQVVESLQPEAVEYLPVPILGHRNRPVAQPYCIIHPVDAVNCLDLDACEPRWHNKRIISVRRLVLDESRIPAGRLLFRPRFFSDVVLAHRTLAQKIDEAGLSGVRWLAPAAYPPRYAPGPPYNNQQNSQPLPPQ